MRSVAATISVLLAGCAPLPYPGLLRDLAREPHAPDSCLVQARRYRDCLRALGVDAAVRVEDRHAKVIIWQADGTAVVVDPTTGKWNRD